MRELAGLKVSFLAGTLGQGGAERQLFYMVEALKNAGGEPRVLCLTRGEHWEERIESIGVEVKWVGQSRSRALRLLKIIRELRRHRPDLLQSQHFYTNIYVCAAARILGLPEIGALRNDAIEEITANPGFLGRRSLTMPRAMAANSRAGIENAINLGAAPDRLFLLPNVVDTSLFTPTSRASDNDVKLLIVARLVRAKRVDRFLRLISALRRRTKASVQGVVAGDGILRRDLELQANALGLDETVVRFLGRVNETNSHYGDANILIVTSDREGTPNAVLEAMASGVPVVATRVGGLGDLVADGETGYLLPVDDEDAMATAVLSLIEDRTKLRQFGMRARAFVEQHHALTLLPPQLLRLYGTVLSRRPSDRGTSKADSNARAVTGSN